MPTGPILVPPIIGWEWWTDKDGEVRQRDEKPQKGDKPVRVPEGQPVPAEVGDSAKHFWAMVVFNYKLKKIQILQITQNGIQRTIRGLERDSDWGSPLDYDLVVERNGEGLETEYDTRAKPKKEIELSLEMLVRAYDPCISCSTHYLDIKFV